MYYNQGGLIKVMPRLDELCNSFVFIFIKKCLQVFSQFFLINYVYVSIYPYHNFLSRVKQSLQSSSYQDIVYNLDAT